MRARKKAAAHSLSCQICMVRTSGQKARYPNARPGRATWVSITDSKYILLSAFVSEGQDCFSSSKV